MLDGAGEQLLRQRRPLVRRMLLGADERHAAGVAGGAQRFGGPAAGMAGADDDDVFVAHAMSSVKAL